MKLNILAFGAHPDDVELSCVGTILKHIDKGYKVGLIDLTRGELGSRGTAETRKVEAENSRKLMGASIRENLDLGDGFFAHNRENMIKVARTIRKYQPDIVLANAKEDRHPNHGAGARLVSEACFHSGLQKIAIDDLAPWRPTAVYHYIQDKNLQADFVIDISDYIDRKMECIQAFKTQFYQNDGAKIDGPATPISGKDFFDYVQAKDKTNGRSIGVEYAEAFNVGRIPGIDDLYDLK